MSTIIAVGDSHFPYHHKKTLKSVIEIIGAVKPDYVIQMGDLYDYFSFGRYPKPHVVLPAVELHEGHKYAVEFWSNVRQQSPKSQCIQLSGNHTDRPIKRIIEASPELLPLISVNQYLTFEGVKTIYDSREELIIDDIIFIHGFLSRLGDHALFYNKSVVCGHSHRAGVVYHNRFNGNKQPIFEFNCGYIGNDSAVPFRYTPTKFSKWTRGVGMIDKWGPRFISL